MRTLVCPVAVGLVLTVTVGGGALPSAAVAGSEEQDAPSGPLGCAPSTVVTVSEARTSSGRFGVALLAAVSGEGSSNALVSPLGIGTVLAMMAQGATGPLRQSIREMTGMASGDSGSAGAEAIAPSATAPAAAGLGGNDSGTGDSETRDLDNADPIDLPCRLAAILGAARDDAGVDLRLANGVFADRRLDLFPAFSTVLRDRFGARVERFDFSDPDSVDRINAWVARETGDAIPHLVSHLAPDSALVLANAIHFQGEWTQPFEPARTQALPFRPQAGAPIEVLTMQAEGLSARYREDTDFHALALPYGEGDFALVVVLPRAGLAPSDALRALTSDPSWLGGAGFRQARGYLALPRVTLDGEASLLPSLRALGLDSALDEAGGFAGIAWPPPVLDRVIHRTMLVLDERGTEAAAATAAIMTTRAAITENDGFEMRVDRPFALAVRHIRTGALLFAAWVANPTGGV